MTSIASTASALATTPQAASDREKLHKAAQAFEAIFVRQMLSSARQTSFGDDIFGSEAADTFKAMRDERFAEIASQSGTLGFARLIEAQLAKQVGDGASGIARASTSSERADVGMKSLINPAQAEPAEARAPLSGGEQ